MRALPIIILLLIFSALGFVYRDTVRAWFTGSTPTAQTVVLRQTATPTPVPAASVLPTVAPVSIATVPTPTPAPSHLPTTGPAENLAVVAGGAALLLLLWRWASGPALPAKRPLDIL